MNKILHLSVLMILLSESLSAEKNVPGQAIFKAEKVSITVNICSNIYTYTVTNLSSWTIMGFSLRHHASYNFIVPNGWEKDGSGGVFQAWTEDTEKGIGPNKTGKFSLRVSSKGAVLGATEVKITTSEGEDIFIDKVWSPVKEPDSYVGLIAGVLVCILLIHSGIIVYKERRKKSINAV